MHVLLQSAFIRQPFEDIGIFIGNVCNAMTVGTADERKCFKIKYILQLTDHPDSSK